MSRIRSSSETFSCSRRVLSYAPLAVAIILSLTRPAHAANIIVDSADGVSGICTLVDAVTALNTQTQTPVDGCAAGDGINDTIDLTGFKTPTTISLTQATPGTGHALVISNSVTINGGLSGQTPLVTIQRSTVSGTASFGLIQNNAPLTINGLTLSNGASAGYAGGAILAGNALTLNYCVIENNQSDSAGGGIAASAGQAVIMHSTITGNTAGNAGGGIESLVPMQIYYSTVANNSTLAATASDNGGGGVFSKASIRILDTTFDGNTSFSAGGGIYATNGANIVDATISNNIASNGSGGGILGSMSGVTVTGSTVNGNHAAGNGGGIDGGPVNLTNSTITGNFATGIGGGVAADALETSYSTIASNTSTGAGGGANFVTSSESQATIFYGNTPDDLATAAGTPMTGLYNIIGIVATSAATAGDYVTCDPVLAALANNGGPTQTMALQTGSCAIDAASPPPAAETTDQRGYSRPSTALTNADIGAYEAGAHDPDVIFADGFDA